MALTHLVSLLRLPWNPVLPAKPYKEVHAKRGILTVEEYRALLALPDLDPRQLVAIALGGLAGMRMGEIRGLRWSDIDQAKGVVHVRTSCVEMDNERNQAKHGSNRDALLAFPITKVLDSWRATPPVKATADFVCAQLDHPERPMPSDTLRKQFLKWIGITNTVRRERALCFHSLRHFFNSQLRGAIPDHVLRELTGHRTPDMTEVYRPVDQHRLPCLVLDVHRHFPASPPAMEVKTVLAVLVALRV